MKGRAASGASVPFVSAAPGSLVPSACHHRDAALADTPIRPPAHTLFHSLGLFWEYFVTPICFRIAENRFSTPCRFAKLMTKAGSPPPPSVRIV